MRTHWWGILGLIGWAYLIAALIYIPLRNSQLGILGGVVLLYCFYMADEAGLLSQFYLSRTFMHSSYTLGSHPAIILSGVLLGNMLYQHKMNANHIYILKWAFGFSLSLFLGGLLLHEQVGQLVAEGLEILRGGEVALGLGPAADRVDDAGDETPDALLAFGLPELASKVLGGDDVRGEERP